MRKHRKFAVLGFSYVGKTSLATRFVDGRFADDYQPTIENTYRAVMEYSGQEYDVDVIDTAGMDELNIFDKKYVIGIHGYVMCFAIDELRSFQNLKDINARLLVACGASSVPRVLVGTKHDLQGQRQVSADEAKALAKEWNCDYIECSAKDDENIALVFKRLMALVEPQKDDGGSSGCSIS